MPNQNNSNKKLSIIYILGALHLFIGLTASVSGLLFMIQSDGSLMGMQSGWLERSPFESYLIPGIF
jgi:hypothetical protein